MYCLYLVTSERRHGDSLTVSVITGGDWKRGSSKNAGVEIAWVEIVASNCRGGNRGSGKRGTRLQGWKTRE